MEMKSTVISCGMATLRTPPSSGQAATSSMLRHPKHLACHSGAAFDRVVAYIDEWEEYGKGEVGANVVEHYRAGQPAKDCHATH